MRKIILVEDRKSRQIQFLPNGEEDITALSKLGFLANKTGEEFKEIINDIEKEPNLDKILNYDLLIFHRSALAERGLVNKVQLFAKEKKKPLIFFSGSITQNIYSEVDFPFLLINSKDFYSSNLIPFLERFNINGEKLIWLLYKDNWRLNYLLKLRDLLVREQNGEDLQFIIEELEEVLGELNYQEVTEEIEKIYKRL